MIEKQRARNDDQKQERRDKILEAARALFENEPYEAVTIAEVAKKTGLAKGTVFFYFKTKEELFLVVLEQLLGEWFNNIDQQLELHPAREIETIADLICQSLVGRRTMTRLLAILHTTLEQNVDYAATLRIKQFLATHLLTTGALLEKSLAFLTAGQGAQTIMQLDALIIGLQHLASPGTVGQQVLEQNPNLGFLAVDFDRELSNSLTTLLYGLQNQAKSS